MPDDLSDVETNFERRLKAMQQRLRDVTPQDVSRDVKISFMSRICTLLDAMHDADLRFPAGKAPSRRQCLHQLHMSVGGPTIHFNIDVRRAVRLSCRVVGDPGTLHYTVSLLDCNIPHGQELVTANSEEVGEWLLRNVVPMAFSQPRPRNLHKLLGGPPGMATADDSSARTPPPPPPATNPLPPRESRRVDLG